MGTKMEDLTGQRYTRWTVLRFSHAVAKNKYWHCRCDCGKEKIVGRSNLKSGASVSCGCYQKERASEVRTKHGQSTHPLYRCWQHMRNRIYNPNSWDYKYYGGRGITICTAWNEYVKFARDMGASWRPGMSIERIDVNGNYTPENCKWIPAYDQPKNARSNIKVDTPDGVVNASDAARTARVTLSTILKRHRAGDTGEALLRVPTKTGIASPKRSVLSLEDLR